MIMNKLKLLFHSYLASSSCGPCDCQSYESPNLLCNCSRHPDTFEEMEIELRLKVNIVSSNYVAKHLKIKKSTNPSLCVNTN